MAILLNFQLEKYRKKTKLTKWKIPQLRVRPRCPPVFGRPRCPPSEASRHHGSPVLFRYVDRMVASLKKIATDSEKMSSLSRLMVMRRDEALEEERTTQPRLDLIRRRTKELQKEVRIEARRYYGRLSRLISKQSEGVRGKTFKNSLN